MAKNTNARFAPGVVWAGKKAKEEAKKLKKEAKKVIARHKTKKAVQKELTGGKGNKPSFRPPIIFEPREGGDEGRGAVKSSFRPPIQKEGLSLRGADVPLEAKTITPRQPGKRPGRGMHGGVVSEPDWVKEHYEGVREALEAKERLGNVQNRVGRFGGYKKGGAVKSKKSAGTSVKTYSSGGYVEGK